ncbi:MAG: tRNA-dihydrouridine synthase family protein [Spirochaetes bacterium]|nr:tRNA-dihydrouridine synthase family protein [Spirochaetota bacterium]
MISDNLPFTSPLVLAPIAGFTDYPFRLLCREQGVGMVYTELISAEALCRGNKKTFELMRLHANEFPAAVQLFGNSPERIARAAQIVCETENPPVLIDINSGCCARKVCSNRSGAALMKDPARFYDIIHQTTAAVKLPITVKIRLGFTQQTKNYMTIMERAVEAGAKAITVHGRTSDQQYSGEADWMTIEEIASNSPIPVIGNGNVTSYVQALDKLKNTSCSGIMIARGAIGNPWIFSGRTPTLIEVVATAKRHAEMMIAYYGEKGLILARKHLVKYFHHRVGSSQVRHSLVTAKTIEELFQVLNSIEQNA